MALMFFNTNNKFFQLFAPTVKRHFFSSFRSTSHYETIITASLKKMHNSLTAQYFSIGNFNALLNLSKIRELNNSRRPRYTNDAQRPHNRKYYKKPVRISYARG